MDEEGSLWGRWNKEVEDYQDYHSEESCEDKLDPPYQIKLITDREKEWGNFSLSFFIRMLYSCLVDADFLDTERFMSGEEVKRNYGDELPVLLDELKKFVKEKGYLSGTEGINGLRSGILRDCINVGRTAEDSLYTLTVPTGGGKTIASMAFALENAVRHHRRHIVYVIPYCSIIEQTVDVFTGIFGEENVLAAYSNADYENEKLRLATENWDKPIVVTTAVQFFESFYSNRSSSCRKLHNVADSVIIFDEAQTLPQSRLLPCIKVIKELCLNYHCAAVLCTATQPALGRFFEQNFIKHLPAPMVPREICSNTEELYEAFRRVTYVRVGTLSDEELAGQLSGYEQVLCIVSTRRQARNVYQLVHSENKFHLSTYMTPAHRREILKVIRERLNRGEQCIVVSTSLIEAGVDVDFPVVYRASAGLDSEIQSGGRCNREGKRSTTESKVYLFRPEEKYRLPPSMQQPVEITEMVTRDAEDIAALPVVKRYFEATYNILDNGDGRGLDIDGIVEQFESAKQFSYPFQSVAAKFHVIDSDTVSVFIPQGDEGERIEYKLCHDLLLSREEYRFIGSHSVNIYPNDAERIQPSVRPLDQRNVILEDMDLYEEDAGLNCEAQKSGEGIFA